MLLFLQGWNCGATQSQLHRGGQIRAALRVGLSVQVAADRQHLAGLSAGSLFVFGFYRFLSAQSGSREEKGGRAAASAAWLRQGQGAAAGLVKQRYSKSGCTLKLHLPPVGEPGVLTNRLHW